uniref:Uncharacterized protein n=1 Tax=Panagrolaimus sp. PS1159 TaxID=55785 RepID=A0AC35FRX2_9BILA
MTTKDEFLFRKNEQKSFANSHIAENENQCINLNINQNLKCTPIHSHSKLYNDKQNLSVSDNYGKNSQTWNKFPKISNLHTFNDEIRKEKLGKNWEGNTNSSTLSIYITAHENSSKAVKFDSFHDNENNLKNNKYGSIKRHEIFDTSTFFIQNPFEFQRQQNYQVPESEMCQYKASQRLLNPNEASIIVQQAGTVTEIWMFFWLLIFVVSTGVIISFTCNKGRQPPTSKKHQRQKNSNAESMKSKKHNVKDGKKGGENNKNNNVEKSRNTGSLKQQQPQSEKNVFQSSSQGDKRESEAEMDSQQQKSEQPSKKDESNKQATNTPYENWDPPRQVENKGDEVEQKSEEKIPPDDAPQKNDNETDKASTKEPKKKKKKKHKKKKAAKDSDEEEDEASTKKEKKKKHKKKKKKEKNNEDKDEEDENQSGKKKKSKKHKKKKVKKETVDEGEGGESETEIEPQKQAEPQITPQPQIPTEKQKPAEEIIPALSLKQTKTKYENVGILQNPKKGKKKGDKHNPGLMTRYNNLLISGDEAEDGKELPSQLKRFVKPPLPKIEDQPSSPLPLPSPVKMLSPAERMPRSLQLDKTQDQSKIITGIENEIVTGLPRSETQKAEKMPKKNNLDKTQDHRYNKENSPPMSLSTTQELPPVKATLQKTQTYFDVTQHDDGTTQKSSLSKLSTGIEDEVFVTGLQRTETQESESTQTLAKVASLTPIETTQCSTLGETQLTTKATQQTQSVAPLSHKSVTEEPLKTATERDQLDQNNPPILLSTKQTKKDASVKIIKKVDEAEKKKLNVEAEREAKKAAEGERLRKLRENAPKPKVLKRNSWEEKVAGGKVFRRKHEYPTMNDVVSDWESEESSENPRKDQPPGTPK